MQVRVITRLTPDLGHIRPDSINMNTDNVHRKVIVALFVIGEKCRANAVDIDRYRVAFVGLDPLSIETTRCDNLYLLAKGPGRDA